jgi:hypothetical protein
MTPEDASANFNTLRDGAWKKKRAISLRVDGT